MNFASAMRQKNEWGGLGPTVRAQFTKKLGRGWKIRMCHPPNFKGATNRYKIKLRSSGYRLVYDVRDAELIVSVVAIGKRERKAVYRSASKRQLM